MKLTTLIARLNRAERAYRRKHKRTPHVWEIYTRRDLGDHVFALCARVTERSRQYGHIRRVQGPRGRLTIQL